MSLKFTSKSLRNDEFCFHGIGFGNPFLEMGGNIIEVDYIESRRGNR